MLSQEVTSVLQRLRFSVDRSASRATWLETGEDFTVTSDERFALGQRVTLIGLSDSAGSMYHMYASSSPSTSLRFWLDAPRFISELINKCGYTSKVNGRFVSVDLGDKTTTVDARKFSTTYNITYEVEHDVGIADALKKMKAVLRAMPRSKRARDARGSMVDMFIEAMADEGLTFEKMKSNKYVAYLEPQDGGVGGVKVGVANDMSCSLSVWGGGKDVSVHVAANLEMYEYSQASKRFAAIVKNLLLLP